MTLDDLRSMGANVDEALARCMGNEEFYLRMVEKCLEDENFVQLGDSLSNGDTDQAFECAHALKGVVSNLSLTPLQEKITELTDLLRERKESGCGELYSDIIGIKEEMMKL